MRKSLLAAVLFGALALTSCKDEFLPQNNKMRIGKNDKGMIDNDNYQYKKQFAIALHAAMADSEPLRQFIKNEALKMFDNDYDILYNYVKDNEVSGTGKTFRNLLLPYFKDETELYAIEQQVPLLTIFVPKLPYDVFSAEKWDTEKIAPYVAVRLRNVCNEVPIFCGTEEESFCLPYGLIPAFPVIVVKDNERVVLPDNPRFNPKAEEYLNVYNEDGTITSIPVQPAVYHSPSGFSFQIPDILFDRLRMDATLARFGNRPWYNPEHFNNQAGGEEVREAWEMIQTDNSLYWQRDHIYYDINQTTPNGRFRDTYHEFITSFEIMTLSTGQNAGRDLIATLNRHNNALDINDPKIKNVVICYDYGQPIENLGWWFGNDKELYDQFGIDMAGVEMNPDVRLGDFWTEGSFDFSVDISMYPKVTSGIGGEQKINKRFKASGEDLFNIVYRLNYIHIKSNKREKWAEWCYSVFDATAKEFYLRYAIGLNYPWRLEDYSNQMKVNIEEVDNGEERTTTNTITSTFNQNFQLNAEINISPIKIGGGYGNSESVSHGYTEVIKETTPNNQLGTLYTFFGNNVIVDETSLGYKFYKYETGSCKFVFRPIRNSISQNY